MATDDFNRANAGNLGANWTANTHESAVDFQIISNAASCNGGSDSSAIYNAAAFANDQFSEVTYLTTQHSGAGSGYGPSCREIVAAQTLVRAIGNLDGFDLQEVVNGSFAPLTSGSGTTFTAGDTFRLETSGSSWRLLKNGVQFATGSGLTLTSGSAGVCYSSTDTSGGITAWAGGDLGAAAVFVPFQPGYQRSPVMAQ